MSAKTWKRIIVGFACVCMPLVGWAQALEPFPFLKAPPEPDGVILNTRSFWRMRIVRETPEIVKPSDAIVHGRVRMTDRRYRGTNLHGWFRANKEARSVPEDGWEVVARAPDRVVTLPSDTPADWASPEFDDGDWIRMSGPVFENFWSRNEDNKLILMRGYFPVDDPKAAGDLKLSLTFRGGAVVYLNGREVARAHMPDGPVTSRTPAAPYPLSADLGEDGFVLRWDRQTHQGALRKLPRDIQDRVAGRVRALTDVAIPADHLQAGVNVLAISIHRAPTPAIRYMTRTRGASGIHDDLWWTRLGLHHVALSAESGAIQSNVGPVSGCGFKVWNQNAAQQVRVGAYPDPAAALRPVRIVAARNGVFSGHLVIGDEKPLQELAVATSALEMPGGAIPASAVEVRYALSDGANDTFDSLEELPPETVALRNGRATQPLWIRVAVPSDVPGGLYRGRLTVSARDVVPVEIALEVEVAAWTLPPHQEFAAHMDFMQSPDTVAMAYDVPMWSDAHMALLDRTFSLLGPMAAKTLFITAIPRTHMGNEYAMIRWARDDEGEFQPDFAVVEKYLDVAMKHMGRIPGIILYAWEPARSDGHALGAGTARRINDRPLLFTVWDPESDELTNRTGPDWGTPEAKEFWKKLTDGLRPALERRGLENSLLFGLLGDNRASKQAMDDICSGWPGARWAVHSHYRCTEWQGHPMGMYIAYWGLGYFPQPVENGYGFGWSAETWAAYYPRHMSLRSRLSEHRCQMEAYMGARRSRAPFLMTRDGVRGLGRLGADFWPVLKDGRGRVRDTLAGRFPEANWGTLNINWGVPRVLGQGRNGPLPTMRSEAFREGAQELEARVYVEKALLDDDAPALLGDDLMLRARIALDERIRIANRTVPNRGAANAEAWYVSSGWRDRASRLFGLAAEIAAKYGDRSPRPNLDRTDMPAAGADDDDEEDEEEGDGHE